MEDVLDLYEQPYDPTRPVVCFDETSKQLVADENSPIPPKQGRMERYDYEYIETELATCSCSANLWEGGVM